MDLSASLLTQNRRLRKVLYQNLSQTVGAGEKLSTGLENNLLTERDAMNNQSYSFVQNLKRTTELSKYVVKSSGVHSRDQYCGDDPFIFCGRIM